MLPPDSTVSRNCHQIPLSAGPHSTVSRNCHQIPLSAGMQLPYMRPSLSWSMHRKLQLTGKQRQHHNPAVFIAQHESLLAVVILTAHISTLDTFVSAELRNVPCQSSCATKRGSCCTPYVSNKQLLWSLVLMPVCCSALQAACFLTAAGSLMFYETPDIVRVLLLLSQQHESTALVLTAPTFGHNECMALCCHTLTKHENASSLTVVHICRFTMSS